METVLFILTGLPGAGKTTYAKQLAQQSDAVVFSLDTEMHKRYGADHHIDLEVREKASKYDLLPEIENLLAQGTSVILDYGFYRQEERARYERMAKRFGVQSRIVYITASYQKLLERIEKRNTEEQNIH
ncbi:MAG: ATP-binding protein, partial [bacterium]|nr:ATP-binding protein [bacterium]